MTKVCRRCNYTAANRSNLLTHLTRVHPCTPYDGCPAHDQNIDVLLAEMGVVPDEIRSQVYTCSHCDATYKHKSTLCKHVKTVHEAKSDERGECSKSLTMLQEKTLETLQRIEIALNAGKTQQTNVKIENQQNNTIQQQNNIQIITTTDQIKTVLKQLRSFGEERMDHLTDDFKRDCLFRMDEGILNMVKEVHCNPHIPENYNVRNKSKKQQLMEVYKDNRWIAMNQNTVLDSMIDRVHRMLGAFFSANLISDSDLRERQDTISHFQNKISEGTRGGFPPNFYYRIRKDIRALIEDTTKQALSL